MAHHCSLTWTEDTKPMVAKCFWTLTNDGTIGVILGLTYIHPRTGKQGDDLIKFSKGGENLIFILDGTHTLQVIETALDGTKTTKNMTMKFLPESSASPNRYWEGFTKAIDDQEKLGLMDSMSAMEKRMAK